MGLRALNRSGEDDSINLVDVFWILFEKKWHILIFTLTACLGSVALFMSLPSRYEASALLMVERAQEQTFVQAQELESLVVTPVVAGTEFYNTQIELIKSHRILSRLERDVKVPELKLQESIEVDHKPLTTLIQITCVFENAQRAAEIANRLAEIYVKEYKSQSLSMSKALMEKIQREGLNLADDERAYEALTNMIGVRKDSEIEQLKTSRRLLNRKIQELSLYYDDSYPEITALKAEQKEISERVRGEILRIVEDWQKALERKDVLLGGIRIFEYARPPEDPIGPPRLRGIIAGTLGGFAGICFLFLLIYQLDPRIKSEEELIRHTGLVCLGTLPGLPRKNAAKLKDGSPFPSSLKNSLECIRTNVLYAWSKENAPLVLLITSPLRGDGKTTFSVLLARSFAEEGRKTILVDADIRGKGASRLFSVQGHRGLSDYLGNSKEPIEGLAVPLSHPNLFIMPAGKSAPPIPHFFRQKEAIELLKKLESQYDRVIIDTPPVLNYAEAIGLSPAVHGVVLLVNTRKADRRLIHKAINRFDRVKEKEGLGGVLNFLKVSGWYAEYRQKDYAESGGKGDK